MIGFVSDNTMALLHHVSRVQVLHCCGASLGYFEIRSRLLGNLCSKLFFGCRFALLLYEPPGGASLSSVGFISHFRGNARNALLRGSRSYGVESNTYPFSTCKDLFYLPCVSVIRGIVVNNLCSSRW